MVTTPATVPHAYASDYVPAAAGVSSYTYMIEGLPAGIPYTVQVTPVNAAGRAVSMSSVPLALAPPLQVSPGPLSPVTPPLHLAPVTVLLPMFNYHCTTPSLCLCTTPSLTSPVLSLSLCPVFVPCTIGPLGAPRCVPVSRFRQQPHRPLDGSPQVRSPHTHTLFLSLLLSHITLIVIDQYPLICNLFLCLDPVSVTVTDPSLYISPVYPLPPQRRRQQRDRLQDRVGPRGLLR